MLKQLLPGLLLLMLAGCGGEAEEEHQLTAAKGDRYYGGTLRLTEAEYLRTLFPPAINDPVSARIATQVYDGLFHIDPADSRLKPLLVESYEANADSTVFVFTLKKGVVFHDDDSFKDGKGRELQASDVQFCFANLCRQLPDNQSFYLVRGLFKGAEKFYRSKLPQAAFGGVTVLDDYRLQINLERTYPQLPELLALPQFLIYPREAFERYGTARPRAVGTGPFRLALVEREIAVTLERNPRYHRRDVHGNQLPYLETVNVQFIPDKRSELAEFRNGHSQIMYRMPPDQFVEILGLETDASQTGLVGAVLAHQPEMITHCLVFNLRRPGFQNSALRRAFAHSINRDVLQGTVLNGEGQGPADHGISPPMTEYKSDTLVRSLAFSPDSARQLLAKSQIPDEKIKLLLYPDGSRNILVGISLIEQVKRAVGIEWSLEPRPLSAFTEQLLKGDFDVALLSFTTYRDNPAAVLAPFYSKNAVSNGGNTYPNFMAYQNPAFDRLYEAAQTAEGRAALRKAHQFLVNDAAVVPLWYNEGYYLLRNNVAGFAINPLALRDYAQVYLKPKPAPASAKR